MTPAFEKAVAFTLGIEGGTSNVAGDRGGLTRGGVTQREYDSWRVRHGLPVQSVELITETEERALYFEDYWTPCRCEDLPQPLGGAVFDMAVNSGQTNAVLTLQAALRVRQDGAIGAVTITAAHNAQDALLAFLKARAGFYADEVSGRPLEVKFLHGWISRLLELAWDGARA